MSNHLFHRRGPVFGIEQATALGPTSGLGNPYRAAEAAGLEGGHGPVVHNSPPDSQQMMQQLLQLMQQMLQHTGG